MSRFLRPLLVLLLACGSKEGTPTATAAPPAGADAAQTCEGGLPEVVAEIDGKPVARDDLEEGAAAELIEARAALYEARKIALENLIMERLIDAELEARGVSEEELLDTEIRQKVTPPTDAEIEAFYNENRSQMRGPLDAMRPQISGYLENQRATDLMRAWLSELRAQYEVRTFLEPFRVEVEAEDSPRLGKADAPVEIIEFSDFQCPFCVMAAETVKEVKDKYGDKVSVVYRHFPLPMHAQAGRAAEAAECAHEQEAFWKFHDALFADQKPWSDEDLRGYAETLELDLDAFDSCMASGRHAETVQDDLEDGRKVGMSGTPGFYINGIMLTGAQPVEAFAEIIDAELAKR